MDKEEGVLARLGGEQTWDQFEDPQLAGMERLALDDEAVWLSGGTEGDPSGRVHREGRAAGRSRRGGQRDRPRGRQTSGR